MNRRTLVLITASLALAPAAATAHEYTVGELALVHPWTRATPGGARVAGGYLTIRNGGSVPDRLVGGSLTAAGRVEIHEMAVIDGVMRMRNLPTGLVVPPGGSIELRPGGYHVMFLDLNTPLREGERVRGTLVFERAGTVTVDFTVQAMGANSQGHGGHRH